MKRRPSASEPARRLETPSFLQGDDPPGGDLLEDLHPAVWPTDLEPIDYLRPAKTEMRPEVAL